MKQKLITQIQLATEKLAEQKGFESPVPEPRVTIPKEEKFGDYSTAAAMVLAKLFNVPPMDLAQEMVDAIGDGGGLINKAEIAGPGFINFFLNKDDMLAVLPRILEQGESYGRVEIGAGKKVQVEFVSANPTGPLHVGHGRNAVYGDTLAGVLEAAGYEVQREYYVNDAGFQINTLGASTYLRYREQLGEKVEIPEGHYVGDYLIDVAKVLREEKGDKLTEADLPMIASFAAGRILTSIQNDLATIGVKFDRWFSETDLHTSGRLAEALEKLKQDKLAYESDGALWFATKNMGDDKDRVLIKSDGKKTYFAADVAYHADKFARGFDLVINVWGADHHGYIARMKAAAQSCGRSADDLEVMLIQLVTLTRGGQVQQMSTRSGKFYLLADLAREVGSDALRYFFLMRRHDSQLEFDIDLALEQSNKNPVFYVQYMHARICSIFGKAEREGVKILDADQADLSTLTTPEEIKLVRHLAEFPLVVGEAAKHREVHRLVGYAYELANQFHFYYHHNRVITDDSDLTAARLVLCRAARQVLNNALGLLGITVPESM
jgi:arginyl-tRNA synthetase